MTPGTRLLEALTAWIDAPDRFARDGLEADVIDAFGAVSTARALYPAAHAIGKRVSVVYPPGEVGPNFTGKVLSLHVFSDRTIAHVKSDGGPVIAVDSAFVHPAPEPGCIVGARIGADAGIAAGRPVLRDDGEAVGVVVPTATTGAFLINTASSEAQQAAMDAVTSVSPSWFPMDGRRVTEGSPGDRLTPGGSTTTLLIPGRVKVTTHMDEYGVKTTETVDLRDLTSPHGRMIEELSAELARNVGETKDFKAGMLAGLEYAVEVVEKIWPKEQK